MEDKQHEDMTIIMQLCRIFSEQMYKCMKNAGLIEQGFTLGMNVGRMGYISNGYTPITSEINIDKASDAPDWKETRMCQVKFSGEEWMIFADPKAEIYSVPENVDIRGTERQEERTAVGRKTANKSYPVDGFWVGADYNDPVLDGGF